MQFHVARNGQTYGPYTLEDLHRYVASGHVLPSDSLKSDEMADWMPVSQFLGSAPAGAPAYTAPSTAGPPMAPFAPLPQVPGPPDLNWVLVLLFDFLTCSLFQLVWNIVLGAWFRRVYPPTKVFLLYIASAVLILLQGVTGQTLGFMSNRHGYSSGHGKGLAGYGFIAVICWVVRLAARFSFRADLEQYYNTVEPIGLQVNPVLTFFFGGIYLQSVMNRINQVKRAAAFGGFPR